jgi:phosphoserine phosphatase
VSNILLIRHGHVEGISPPRFRGRADLPLIPRGIAEANAVARRIASNWRPTKVYTSPLARCIETGHAVSHAPKGENLYPGLPAWVAASFLLRS